MSKTVKISRRQLLKMIDELETNPRDRLRILGDAGITVIGAGLGAAAAGTVATAVGATSIFGLTTAAGWFGVTAIAVTPVGWVIGGAAAAAAAAYGVSRLIRGGGLAEGRKLELLQKYREDSRGIEAKERAGSIAVEDRTRFILSLRELIDKSAMAPEKAFKLIEHVEQGHIPLSQAFSLIQALLSGGEVTVASSS